MGCHSMSTDTYRGKTPVYLLSLCNSIGFARKYDD